MGALRHGTVGISSTTSHLSHLLRSLAHIVCYFSAHVKVYFYFLPSSSILRLAAQAGACAPPALCAYTALFLRRLKIQAASAALPASAAPAAARAITVAVEVPAAALTPVSVSPSHQLPFSPT